MLLWINIFKSFFKTPDLDSEALILGWLHLSVRSPGLTGPSSLTRCPGLRWPRPATGWAGSSPGPCQTERDRSDPISLPGDRFKECVGKFVGKIITNVRTQNTTMIKSSQNYCDCTILETMNISKRRNLINMTTANIRNMWHT